MPDDLSLLSHACRELYSPGLMEGNVVSRSFRFLRSLVPGELLACGVLRGNSLEIGFDQDHPDIPAAMRALSEHMHRYPLHNWDPTVNGGRPFCRSQFFSLRQFRNIDIYHEVYRPLGIDNHCAIHVPTVPGEILFFGVERQGGPDFSPREMRLLELAQEQLANVQRTIQVQRSGGGPVSRELLERAGLTPRQAEVLEWIAKGKTNPEIALLMGIGLDTVKSHVTAIFDKSGAGNRFAAIVWAKDVCRRLARELPHASEPIDVTKRGARRAAQALWKGRLDASLS